LNSIVLAFDKIRTDIYNWRVGQSWLVKLLMAFGFALLLGLFANIKILTPLSPVAFSLSTFGALLIGVVLGRRWGGVSVAIYAVMALIGLPVMTTATVGITFGYVIGFAAAALFIGYLVDHVIKSRKFAPLFLVMTVAAMVILLFGTIWMWLWIGGELSLWETLRLSAVPFIIPDLLKAIAAATLATIILPKK